jgi:chromosomal replication initiation ATPase DnaA
MINPYVFPGLKISLLEREKFPFINFESIEVTRDEIFDVVCKECSVTKEQLVSECRKRTIVDARKMLCAALKIKHRVTLTEIGDRDHTSIRHLLLKFKDHCNTDEDFRRKAKSVLNKIGSDFQENYIKIVDNR